MGWGYGSNLVMPSPSSVFANLPGLPFCLKAAPSTTGTATSCLECMSNYDLILGKCVEQACKIFSQMLGKCVDDLKPS